MAAYPSWKVLLTAPKAYDGLFYWGIIRIEISVILRNFGNALENKNSFSKKPILVLRSVMLRMAADNARE